MALSPPPPVHVIAGLRFLDAREVVYVDCVCGWRASSLAAWEAHLTGAGQHPGGRLGPPLGPSVWTVRRFPR